MFTPNPGVFAAGATGFPVGQRLIESTSSFVVPDGVTSISVVCISPGGPVSGGRTGFGGALRYVNAIPVTSGETLAATIQTGSSPYSSFRRGSTDLVSAIGQNGGVGTGFNGGTGMTGAIYPRAGAGAAGYISNGENAAVSGSLNQGGGGTDPRQANAPGATKGSSNEGSGRGGKYGGGAGVYNTGDGQGSGVQGAGCIYIIYGENRALPGTNIGEIA